MPILEVEDWGLTDYAQALNRQEELVQKVANDRLPGVVVLCSHPPVVTLGRKAEPRDTAGWTGPVMEISRGGKATYHGPSQIVMYPIWNLDVEHPKRPHRDIHWYLRSLEEVMIRAVKDFGLEAQGRSLQNDSEETGLWVGRQKLASIGIGVRRWVSFHGLALNVDHDPLAFQGIRPCGMDPDVMVSMEKLLGQPVDHELVKARLLKHFTDIFH